MRYGLILLMAGGLISSSLQLALAQQATQVLVTRQGAGAIAGTALSGARNPTQIPLLQGTGRFGAGTGGTNRGVGNATGGINGAPRAGTGGIRDTVSLGTATGGIQGTGVGLDAGIGGTRDQGSYGRDTGGIAGVSTGFGGLGAGTGGIEDSNSLGAATGGVAENNAPRFQILR
jgi:hypothetical protein